MVDRGKNIMFKRCGMQPGYMPMGCGCESPIIEPVINKCVEKDYYHEVKHVCPFHTHVVNKHIYNHTYTPQYSVSEEEQVIDNNNGCCGGYMNNGY